MTIRTEIFEIGFRWSWKASISVEIECDTTASLGLKRGLAVRAALKSRADLSDAVLSGADLRGADLRGADLWDCVANGAHMRTITTDIWTATYTADVLQIGCQHHPITDWWAFEDQRIAEMAGQALEWWKRWKPILQNIIEAAPCEPTGAKQEEMK